MSALGGIRAQLCGNERTRRKDVLLKICLVFELCQRCEDQSSLFHAQHTG